MNSGWPLPSATIRRERASGTRWSTGCSRFISLTWKGQPLLNYETVVNLIGATKTKSGLQVKAVLDTHEYETGVKVTKSQMEQLSVRRHKIHPDWNYTLKPRT